MFAPQTVIANRYEVIRLIGQGGMSNLYLCRDRKYNNAVVVIKEMTAAYSDPKEQQMAVDLFHREAKLLSSLNHRHIPKVFDYFQYQGKYYLSMEYVDGEDLGKILARDPNPLEEASCVEWGGEMATVLYYLHVHKPPIVFRDVKPSNIMMTKNGVKLIDFGIARHFDVSKKGDTMRIGSPGYAPPEQYSGQTDPRSDIYALGVTLHHALTGRDPTTTQTPFILPPARDLNPKVSQGMADILAKATQLDPNDRYDTMLEMKRDLKALTGGAAHKDSTRVVSGPPTNPSATVPHSGPPPAPTSAPPASPAPAPASQPAPAPAASTSSGQPQQPSTPSPPAQPKKGFPFLLLAAMLLLTLGIGMAIKFPHLFEGGRVNALDLWNRLFEGQLPDDPSLAAERLYRNGGPLGVALDKLTLESPREEILRNNILVALAEKPALRVGAVLAQDQESFLLGLLRAQTDLNSRGGLQGRLLVLEIEMAQEGSADSALRTVSRGRAGRTESGSEPTPPDLLLTFLRTEGDSSLPVYGLAELNLGEAVEALAEVDGLEQAVSQLVSGPVWWLLSEPPSKLEATVEKAPSNPEEALALLGRSGQATVVVKAEQSQALLKARDGFPGAKLLLVGFSRSQLPEPKTGLTAVVRSSVFEAKEFVNNETARAYDLLTWSSLVFSGESSYRGITVSVRGSDTRPSAYAYLKSEQDRGWTFQEVVKP